jgi:hypothetical protein
MSTSEKILRIMFCVVTFVVGAAAGQSVLNQLDKPNAIGNICSILLGYIGVALIVSSSFAFGITMLSDIFKDE